jgi:GxxExxY protein
MPIIPAINARRISQQEFGELSYEVMKHVFDIHSEFGRFFDEAIYKRELAARMKDVRLEVPVDVVHGTFSKTYFADVLVRECGLFEFKATDGIHSRHRGQAIHYLHLFDLGRGKIINVRPKQVEHEFINCNQRLCELTKPHLHEDQWDARLAASDPLHTILTNLLADWGTGLDVALYEEAVTHFLGGESRVRVAVPVSGSSGTLGNQPMRLFSPEVAFKITTFPRPDESFRIHTQRLLQHTPLQALQWINIAPHEVTFSTIHTRS